jgi:hypothetical protein
VAPAGNGVVTTTVVSVAVAVSNTGDAAAASGTMTIALSRSPLATSAEVTAGSTRGRSPTRPWPPVPVTAVVARGTATATAAVDLGALGALAPGVYPLSAAYSSPTTGAQPLVAHSVLTVPDAASAASGVGVVVPITAPPTTTGLLSADDLKALTADDGALRTQLNAVTGTPAILAVDPAIPAAIRVLGSSAPASARQWLADLLALPNSRFALQFGDADLATQIAAGLPRLCASPASIPSCRRGTSPPPPWPPAQAPQRPPRPTGARCPPSTSCSTSARRAPTSSGPRRAPPRRVSSPHCRARPPPARPSPLRSRSWARVLSAVPSGTSGCRGRRHPRLRRRRLERAAHRLARLRPRAPGAGLAAASAYASVATRCRRLRAAARRRRPCDRTVRDGPAGGDHGGILLAGRTPWDLDALLAAPAASVSVTGGTADDPTRVDALRDLLDQETRVAAFATVLADPTLLTAPDRAEILQLMGNVWRAAPDQFATALSDHRDATTTTLGSVAIVPRATSRCWPPRLRSPSRCATICRGPSP